MLGDVDKSGNEDETALSECWEIKRVLYSISGGEDVHSWKELCET